MTSEMKQTQSLILAEMLYAPRPHEPRRRIVFDAALRSRWRALSAGDRVLLICASDAVFSSLEPLVREFPHLTFEIRLVNPTAVSHPTSDTPQRCGWPDPDRWQQFTTTDRWARLLCALEAGAASQGDGWLILPAQDAVFGRDLLPRLIGFSHEHATDGKPAPVSPWAQHQHAPVRGARIDPLIIGAVNAAFGRDATFRRRIESNEAQQFWGKLGMIPFRLCAGLLERVETRVWEDDAEIDAALRDLNAPARCLWVSDPRRYHQAPPVFDRADLYRVIERHLHYAIHGGSAFTQPLPPMLARRAARDPRFAAANALAESVIAEAEIALRQRLDQFGLSWVDWGAYRITARPRDPFVEVWKLEQSRREQRARGISILSPHSS